MEYICQSWHVQKECLKMARVYIFISLFGVAKLHLISVNIQCGECLFFPTHESYQIKTKKYNTLIGEDNFFVIFWTTSRIKLTEYKPDI